jgi:hypothetical protein
MGEVGRMLHSYQKRYNKKIYLVDRDGLIQVHPDRQLIQKVNIRELPGIIGEVPRLHADKAHSGSQFSESSGLTTPDGVRFKTWV